MKARLILEDGHVFEGESFGAVHDVISEFVFNTAMTGYVEVLTDPSYAGQSVVMTYPLIGNYGVPLDDQEAAHPFVEAFVVSELSRLGSNFRMNMSLNDYMIENNIPGIQGVDTRAITRILRKEGCMNGMITTKDYEVSEVIDQLKAFKIQGVVEKCSCLENPTMSVKVTTKLPSTTSVPSAISPENWPKEAAVSQSCRLTPRPNMS
ncbi:carbamoyl phosphate synthase small subunit [Lactobacillus delbrueckii subsp. lactis]|uniref:carbamoyl phosphate synthase small subunit n=1 Tax=Lactobacillus delbrueckii TaxID=1584 RepID=UPI000A5347CB|nr:carbamoyl phosphate synthase small subunit [Lactobacillus delbrueckii]MCD5505752.1 carbamoyl phosphate synthase small subunit [Lactobacillus delbrueckii subsp. lactis]MCD5518938.1 carbamoyl phosphate synthase small subunit [Lactobacillus delbrueckii subsp. lactis]MCD5522881.1 carbamoyl phosphate synthase small subunit [Lactobacillus delbrueckii subsp. lactis]MCD5524727.1 carbamoyl phosphate synthase small subunit [Lactobacillus delbrueckii subsp. lactis]MCD5548483.1 carbamoyl phosphate synt